MAHGHFFIMGGVLLCRDGQPIQVVYPDVFSKLLNNGCIQFPTINEQEIRDKSRTNPLFAGMVVIQTIWFLVQCIARLVKGYGITKLELVTLSLVIMNGILLTLWWDKPLDTQHHIQIDQIHFPSSRPDPIPNQDPEDISARIRWDLRRENQLAKRLKIMMRSEGSVSNHKENLVVRCAKAAVLAPYYLVVKLCADFGDMWLRFEADTVEEGALEVPMFYAPDTSTSLGPTLFIIANILGSCFAASHLSLWASYFPSVKSRLVWRVCALITTFIPWLYLCGMAILVGLYIFIEIYFNRWTRITLQLIQGLALLGILLGFPTFMAARMALLVEAFICLKSASPSLFLAVPWTNYIPHFS